MTTHSDLKAQDISALYFLIGEAVFMIQHLEGALSVSITLKKDVKYPGTIPKEEANNRLKKHQSLTLRQAINLAKENGLHSDIYDDLKALSEERNWLVHKLVNHNLSDLHTISIRERLFHRIKTISEKANIFQRLVETDLIEFSESNGINMSRVRAAIKQYYHET